jgi:hypoxanthine phosphoribosyltransferase
MSGIPGRPPVLISEEAIRNRVGELARRISTDYAGVDEVLLVGVLRGCFIFLADLARQLEVDRRIDFIAVSSYDSEPATPGAVRLIMDLRTEIAGRHVLIVEDIVDSGRTLRYLGNLLRSRRPASLKTCALLRKPDRLRETVQIDYLGFDIPDFWVVGYGLDYADQNRALPYIGVVGSLPRPPDP